MDPANPSAAGVNPVTVIKDTCYADVVGTVNSGDKYRADYVRFTYNSFSYDTSNDSSQRLKCSVTFCIHTGTAGNYAIDSTCTAKIKPDQNSCNSVANHGSYAWKFYA